MSKGEQFWEWFKENEAKFFFLNQVDDADERESILDNLLEHLHSYCDQLYFQIGGYPDAKQDLIITAEGNTDFFDKVEALVKQAPQLEYWSVIAFKPVMEGGSIEYNGIKLDPETMYFIPLENKASQKLGVRMYVNNYDSENEKDFLTAGYWLLDNILGERSSALDIGYVEIENLPSTPEKEELIELIKLPRYIAWKKSKA
jgi:hypothetical protein